MFLVVPGPDPTFLIAAIKKHDEANRLAERIVLTFNPVTGIPEVTHTDRPGSGQPKPKPPIGPQSGWHNPMLAFSCTELTERLGISPEIVDECRQVSSEDELYLAIDEAPGWQSDALLALVTGDSIETVIESLELVASGPVQAGDEAAAFDKPAAKTEFTRITSDDDLLQVLSGSFAGWRTFLHPAQRRYAYRDSYSGPFRLSGGAGTGKTVVALHRARHLATMNPKARIIVTTLTTTLAESLQRSFEELDPTVDLAVKLGDPGVLIMGVDKLAVAALRFAGPDAVAAVAPHLLPDGGMRITALTDDEDRSIWDEVLRDRGQGLRSDLASVGFLKAEYRTVILANQVADWTTYAAVARPGRGTRLTRADRQAVWAVAERYRERLGQSGRATFAEIAATAGRALQRVSAPADHVVIDEAQDLHGGHWRLLRGLAADGPDDLFICEDSHQRIYGEKLVLGQLGIAIRGRSRRLTLNYRTTRQNLNYAVGILAGAEITDLEGCDEETSAYRSAMSGPPPRVISASTNDDEARAIAETLSTWSKEADAEPETFAVLVRDKGRRDRLVRDLAGRGMSLQVIEGAAQPIAGKPQILTMHRAKGLEFRRVILVGVTGNAFSSSGPGGALSDEERRDAAARQRMLLYVAATRARDELVVTWSGSASEHLPKNGSI